TRTLVPLSPSNPPRTFQTQFTYDSFGRMLQLVYPDGETLSYGYDGGGLLSSAVGRRPPTKHTPAETESYLASMQYDEFGSRVSRTLGTGAPTSYAYDPKPRRLVSLQTTTSHRPLQALAYSYDRVGNLLNAVNGLPPSTNKSSGPVSFKFQYDA